MRAPRSHGVLDGPAQGPRLRSRLRRLEEPHTQQCGPRPSGDRGACSDLRPRTRASAWWQVWSQKPLEEDQTLLEAL